MQSVSTILSGTVFLRNFSYERNWREIFFILAQGNPRFLAPRVRGSAIFVINVAKNGSIESC